MNSTKEFYISQSESGNWLLEELQENLWEVVGNFRKQETAVQCMNFLRNGGKMIDWISINPEYSELSKPDVSEDYNVI